MDTLHAPVVTQFEHHQLLNVTYTSDIIHTTGIALQHVSVMYLPAYASFHERSSRVAEPLLEQALEARHVPLEFA